jgi:hypothetical protein
MDAEVTWWENTTGDGTSWTEHAVAVSYGGARSVHTADVDGDDDPDIVSAGYTADDVTWWENVAGDGSTWTEHTITSSFYGAWSVFAADIDGDDDVDVLAGANAGDAVTWWENTSGDGSTWSEHVVDGSFDGTWTVRAADLDLDGDLDVLGAAWNGDQMAWWENTAGDGTAWTEHMIDSYFDSARWVHVADVDGDTDLDVLGAAYDADDITWWENGCIP